MNTHEVNSPDDRTMPPKEGIAAPSQLPGDTTTDRAMLDALEAEAQRALKERPSLSMRRRLSAGFFLCFLFCAAVSIAWLITVARIQTKLQFMVVADNYTFEIQQARRFEKNFFLYGTNLGDARDHVASARQLLISSGEKITAVIGETSYKTMIRHIDRYDALLASLQSGDTDRNGVRGDKTAIEAELRNHGAEMVSVAQELGSKERQAVNAMLKLAQRLPIIFLILLVGLMAYLVDFLRRQLLRRLNRLMEATRQIAEGDFTPIYPRSKYRDEFTELSMALNHMIHELVLRQDMLIRSHKLQAVGTLTAGVAHELNNPINNITLTAEMLKEDYRQLCDEERLEMIQDLIDQAERSQRIVRNLLDFARETELRAEHLNVRELIDDTLKLSTNQIKLARVKVKVDVPTTLPPIYGDRQQLRQVILNLVLNALDAMPEGGALTLSASNSNEREHLEIKVEDTGTGIPAHVLQKIFDPFFTTKAGTAGTGLGLSVSLGIIRRHGGDILINTKVGKGTCFTLLMPTAKIPARELPARNAGWAPDP
jgi:two-component system, NtrC family, sensor kinase